MKKIIISVVVACICVSVYGMGKENETMTWAEYEAICEKNGAVASYENYIKAVETPQCFGDNEESVIALFSIDQNANKK